MMVLQNPSHSSRGRGQKRGCAPASVLSPDPPSFPSVGWPESPCGSGQSDHGGKKHIFFRQQANSHRLIAIEGERQVLKLVGMKILLLSVSTRDWANQPCHFAILHLFLACHFWCAFFSPFVNFFWKKIAKQFCLFFLCPVREKRE